MSLPSQTCIIGSQGYGVTSFAWNGLKADGTAAPPGVYLYQFSLIDSNGNVVDTDKSSFLSPITSPAANAVLASDDGTTATYQVSYGLSGTDTPPISASAGKVDVYDPNQALIHTYTMQSGDLTPGQHTVSVSIPSPTLVGNYTFLVSAQDNDANKDVAGRQRWALQHNQKGTALLGTINLTGPAVDSSGNPVLDSNGNPQILIGQKCQALLVPTKTATANNITFSNYHWSAGSDTFISYGVAPDNSTAQVNPVPASGWQRTSPVWMYLKEGNGQPYTITCTATINVNGVAGGTVTITKQVNVQAPNYRFFDATSEYPVGQVALLPPTSSNPGVWTLATEGVTGQSKHGATFHGKVNVPPLFLSPAASISTGLWRFVQKITPQRTKTLRNNQIVPCTENGKVGLDTSYPYPATADDPFSKDGSGNLLTAWLTDGAEHQTGDSPSTNVTNNNINVTIGNATMGESFDVYMMYLPPKDAAGDSDWVSLYLFSWSWNANISQPVIKAIPPVTSNALTTDSTSLGSSWSNFDTTLPAGTVQKTAGGNSRMQPSWIRVEGPSVVGTGW